MRCIARVRALERVAAHAVFVLKKISIACFCLRTHQRNTSTVFFVILSKVEAFILI